MWPTTSLTKILNIHLPIIQAPMAGGISSSALVAAASNSGGLGSVGAAYLQASALKKEIQTIKQLTKNPFAVNLFIPQAFQAIPEKMQAMVNIIDDISPESEISLSDIKAPYIPSFEELFNVIVEEKVPVFSFTFGKLEEKYIYLCKENHIKIIGTATSLQEALILEQQGVDAIVAQGSEAGGHRGTFQENMNAPILELNTLLQQLSQIKIPIIAAGGIMNANGIVSALKQGAQAVQMGTAFICCHESGATSGYQQALLNTKQGKTTLSRAFSGRLARVIANQFTVKMKPFENNILDFPIQNALTSIMRNKAKADGNIELMSLYTGIGHYLCKRLPAARLIEELDQEVRVLLKDV
jgi:nitronate monooxygenase